VSLRELAWLGVRSNASLPTLCSYFLQASIHSLIKRDAALPLGQSAQHWYVITPLMISNYSSFAKDSTQGNSQCTSRVVKFLAFSVPWIHIDERYISLTESHVFILIVMWITDSRRRHCERNITAAVNQSGVTARVFYWADDYFRLCYHFSLAF